MKKVVCLVLTLMLMGAVIAFGGCSGEGKSDAPTLIIESTMEASTPTQPQIDPEEELYLAWMAELKTFLGEHEQTMQALAELFQLC